MSMRQQVMMGLLAITLVAMLGMTAAWDLGPNVGVLQPNMWLDSSVPDDLLASRLNLTNIAKTPHRP